MRITIDEEDFKAWEKARYVAYASVSIKRGGQHRRLGFEVNLSGGYLVLLGREALYEGTDLSEAMKAFHDAQ